MAGASRGACAADGGTSRGARPRGSAGEARRPHWLCDLLVAGGGKRGSGPRISRPPRRFRTRVAGRADERIGGSRAALPRRSAHLGRRAVDDAVPHRYRWILRFGARAAALSLHGGGRQVLRLMTKTPALTGSRAPRT